MPGVLASKGDLLGCFLSHAGCEKTRHHQDQDDIFFFFFEDSRKPELKPSFATIASWESQVIIAIQPPQGLTVTIIYLHPQPLPSRKVQQLLTTSQHRVILAWEVCCLTVGKRFWSTNKKLGALTWMIIEVAAGSLKYWKITRWWFQIYIYIIVYL